MNAPWICTGWTCLLLLTAGSALAQTLTSDRSDYRPGEIATLTGAGFQPNEPVSLQVLHADEIPSTGDDHETWSVIADGDGGFVTEWRVCEDDCRGSLLRATAVGGLSGLSADVTFTDALGNARLTSVVPVDGGCVSGPTGNGVQSWDVVQGKTYRLTLTNVDDCANGGTDATIEVMVKNSATGNVCITATRTAPQTYVFDFTLPASPAQSACNTYPIDYCTSNCNASTGNRVRRNDGGNQQAHLRAATFAAGCTSPTQDNDCGGIGPICTDCTLSCPPDADLACGASTDTLATGGARSSCAVTWEDAATAAGCAGVAGVDRTWKATNACGTVTSCVQRIRFSDTTPPEISCPPDVTLADGDATDTTSIGGAKASDDCGAVETEYRDDPAGGCTGNDIDRTWTARDGCGNTATCTQRIRFTATGSAAVTCPPDLTLPCGESSDPNASNSPSDPNATYSDAPAGGCTGRDIDRTWTITDDCGRTGTCVQRIRYVDTTPPVLQCPPDVRTKLGNACTPTQTGTAQASDNCGSVTVTSSDRIVGGCTGKDVERTWTARDACGSVATCTQRITFDYVGTVTATNNGPICAGQTLRLYATYVSGATYKWTGPNGYTSSSQNPSISCAAAKHAGSYCVTLTKNGCKSPPVCTQVVVGTIPVSTITGPASLLEGSTGELCGPIGNYGYAWSNGATTRCIAAGPGSYSLRVTDLATRCQSTSCSFTVKKISCACNLGYPDYSKTPRSSLCFTDEPILKSYDPKTCRIEGSWLRAFYDDEASMILGVRRVVVRTSSTTSTTDFTVTPDQGGPACVTAPVFGATAQTGDLAGTDRYGRPWYPALFITDVTANPTSRSGDWQQGGVAIPPHKVCGRWKSVVRTLDKRYSPAKVTYTLDPDPERNYGALGADSDEPLEGSGCLNEGFGAEVAWDIARLGLVPGRVYRMQFMFQDGNQTQSTGGCDQACVNVLIPVTIGTSTALASPIAAADETQESTVDFEAPETSGSLPVAFEMTQEPNPFLGATTIRYAVPEAADVTLRVYSVLGQEVATLVSDRAAAGRHAFVWHATDGSRPLAPGVYVLRMSARGASGRSWDRTQKTILLR